MELRADSTSNRSVLVGRVIEREPLRYTPAGIPIVELKITHVSEQLEAGKPRQVELEVWAVAAGELTGRLSKTPLGAKIRATGFLAHKGKAKIQVVLHITEFEYI